MRHWLASLPVMGLKERIRQLMDLFVKVRWLAPGVEPELRACKSALEGGISFMKAKNKLLKERLRKNKKNADDREKKLKKLLEQAERDIQDMPGLRKDLQAAERTVAGHDRIACVEEGAR